MPRRIFPFILIIALALSWYTPLETHAQAQNQPELSTLRISLWPEYDRSSVLVIYRAMLAPNTSLPVNMVFRIPLEAEPYVAAVGPTPESVDEVSYSQRSVGQWKEITFPATFPAIHFEYYDNDLQIVDQARHFEYHWPGDYSVNSLLIEIQKPLGASNVHIAPNIEKIQVNEDGLEYYVTQIGALAPGQAFTIALDYTKNTQTLTAEELKINPSGPISVSTPGRNRLRNILVVIFAILGVALIAGGGWWYWQSGQKEPRSEPRRRSRGKRPLAAKAEAMTAGEVYCHQCGKRAGSGDRYCRSCGTRLRLE